MADSYHIIDGQVVPFHGGRKDTNTGAWRDATPLELQLQEQLAAAEEALAEAAAALEAAREDAWQPIVAGGPLPPVGEWALVLTDTYEGCRPDLLFLSPNKPRFAVIPAQLRCVDDEGWPTWQRWQLASGHPCGILEGDTHWRPLPAPPAIDQARGKGGGEVGP